MVNGARSLVALFATAVFGLACGTSSFQGASGSDAGGSTTDAGDASTSADSGAILLGDFESENDPETLAAGSAQAYQFVANATGTVGHVGVFIDSGNTCTSVEVGIYTSANGHADTLLAKGTLTAPGVGWQEAPATTSAEVTAGTSYWVALLCTVSGLGELHYRDTSTSTLGSEHEVDTTLVDLPAHWAPGTTNAKDGPVSAYGAL